MQAWEGKGDAAAHGRVGKSGTGVQMGRKELSNTVRDRRRKLTT